MRDAIEKPEGASLAPAIGRELRDAERYCAAMARREAKNFYWGFIALPHAQRVAIYALYDFARQVDDVVDQRAAQDPAASLRRHRERLRRCLGGDWDDPVTQVLGVAVTRFRIPGSELAQVIDGVEMDLNRKRYRSWEELESYCRLVASAIGRMCVRIFGFQDPAALGFADQLGLAMQLTNILRDVKEDFELGRIYLPQDELERFGVTEAELASRLRPGSQADGFDPAWQRFVALQTERARGLFDSGLRVAELVPRSSAACVRTMAGIYQQLLERIEKDPLLPLGARISLSTPRKLMVALRAWRAA